MSLTSDGRLVLASHETNFLEKTENGLNHKTLK